MATDTGMRSVEACVADVRRCIGQVAALMLHEELADWVECLLLLGRELEYDADYVAAQLLSLYGGEGALDALPATDRGWFTPEQCRKLAEAMMVLHGSLLRARETLALSSGYRSGRQGLPLRTF